MFKIVFKKQFHADKNKEYAPKAEDSDFKFGRKPSLCGKINVGCISFLSILVGLFFIQILSGCGSEWEKKFIRKTEKQARPAQFEVDKTNRAYEALYKEHFLYWKAWHDELIHDVGTNEKKVERDILETRRQLNSLAKYVKEETGAKIYVFVADFDQIVRRLNRGILNANDHGMIKRDLDRLRRRIYRELKFKKIESELLPTPVGLDLSKYEGEEPLVFEEPTDAGVVKKDAESADTPTDENKPLTYDEYRQRITE